MTLNIPLWRTVSLSDSINRPSQTVCSLDFTLAGELTAYNPSNKCKDSGECRSGFASTISESPLPVNVVKRVFLLSRTKSPLHSKQFLYHHCDPIFSRNYHSNQCSSPKHICCYHNCDKVKIVVYRRVHLSLNPQQPLGIGEQNYCRSVLLISLEYTFIITSFLFFVQPAPPILTHEC
jgi:hypothetical protein